MRVVVLDYAKRRGRAYYEGAYDPAKPGSPLCWSDDGVKPHASVKEPKCGTCEGCPLAVKGSKITEQGKAVTACSQHRMIVVVPAGKLDFTPMRMKLAITSDWDKNSPELEQQGWFAFNNYTDFLRTKSVPHTAAIVTKMKFDPNVPYPKVMFSPDRWLEQDELAQVRTVLKSDAVSGLLNGTWSPAGVDGVKTPAADEDDEPAPKPKAAKAPPKAMDDDEDDEPAPKPKAAKAAPKPAAKQVMEDDDDEPAPKPKAKKKAPVEDDDDEVEIIPPSKKAKAEPEPKAKAKKAKAEEEGVEEGAIPDDVADLLDEWADD
jgi:hypothetical protein